MSVSSASRLLRLSSKIVTTGEVADTTRSVDGGLGVHKSGQVVLARRLGRVGGGGVVEARGPAAGFKFRRCAQCA